LSEQTLTTEKEIVAPHPIDIEFFSKQSNKTTKLVNSGEGFKVEGAHRWFEFNFIEPVYLSQLKIRSTGYDEWYKFEVEVFHSDQTTHRESISVANNLVSLDLGKLSVGFRFRPEARWVTKTEILNVEVTGLSLDEFHNYEWSIKNLSVRERNVAEREQKLEQLKADEATLNSNLKEVTSEVGKLIAQRSELTESLAALSEQIDDRQATSKDLQSEIETLQERRRDIRSQISASEGELSNLTQKLRLFPTEIAGFVKEGNRNIKTYLLLGVPFTAIFVVVL
tara:strand:- start:63 stop:905 length:843 start_codon:yes stop_codon:yes gene_type:complete